MPHSTTKTKRTKRDDFRPNGKRRRKEQQAAVEKDRLARVAANELKGKILEPLKLEKIVPSSSITEKQPLRKDRQSPAAIRIRALHKLLRQILVLAEKEKAGETLNDAQRAKLSRFDAVASELEELQKESESDDDRSSEDEE